DLTGFWAAIWDQLGVRAHTPYREVLSGRELPGARWFPGATLNFAGHALAGAAPRGPAAGRPDSAADAGRSGGAADTGWSGGVAAGGVDPGRTGGDPRWRPGGDLSRPGRDLLWRPGGDPDRPALIARSQTRPEQRLTYAELADAVTRAAAGLRRLGVRPGDRVVGYLPNCVEAVVGFLASAAIGAVWSSCAPEFGVGPVLDRFAQIRLKVVRAVDGDRYGTRSIDRTDGVRAIAAGLPTLDALVVVPYLGAGGALLADRTGPARHGWQDLLAGEAPLLVYESVPFDHPLYVLYSSGTTGLPKAIVHSHGGILVEHLKMLALHLDIHPGDRFFWFTTTGWMMWNY